jgi:RimJ/RimL family protein N-acetyltransferase
MNEPMIIIEKEYQIPDVILDWAQSHSVPVLSCHDFDCFSLNYDYIIEYSDEITIDYLNMTYCHAHNLPATIAITGRLILREIGTDDLNIYQRLIEENPAVISDKSLLGLSAEEFKERHLAYMKYSYQFLGYGIWGIFLSGEIMIGIAGLDGTDKISLSYALLKKYQGYGYAYEAVSEIINYAVHELEIRQIKLDIQKDNLSSIKLAEKIQNIYPNILQVNILD